MWLFTCTAPRRQKINMGLIEENWDDLPRLAASIKFGHATASLIVGKLSGSSRHGPE
jgi:TnpA family transposase